MECNGLFGKIFGHLFRSKIIEYKAPTITDFELQGFGSISNMISSLADKKYVIICHRCGIRLKENDNSV